MVLVLIFLCFKVRVRDGGVEAAEDEDDGAGLIAPKENGEENEAEEVVGMEYLSVELSYTNLGCLAPLIFWSCSSFHQSSAHARPVAEVLSKLEPERVRNILCKEGSSFSPSLSLTSCSYAAIMDGEDSRQQTAVKMSFTLVKLSSWR